LVRLPSFKLPLDRDEGEFATLAQQWMTGGGLPYRDFLEQKPPLGIAANALAFRWMGMSASSIRLLALFSQLAALLFFVLLVRKLAGARAAWWAGLLFALASASPRAQGLAANAESWTVLPLMMGLWLLVGGADWPAGLCLGLAVLAKQSILPLVALLPLGLAAEPGRMKRVGKLWMAIFLPLLVVWSYFWSQGSARDFVYCTVGYDLAYAGQGTTGFFSRLARALHGLAPEQIGLWVMAALGLVAPGGGRPESVDSGIRLAGCKVGRFAGGRRILHVWLLAAVVGVCLSGRFYPHYFLLLAGPLAALGGVWIASVRGGLGDVEFSPGGRILRAAFFLIFIFGWVAASHPLWSASDAEAMSRAQYGYAVPAQSAEAARALKQVDPQGVRLWMWGSEAELYFLSGRRPATRFLFAYPFTGESAAWTGGEREMEAALDDPRTTAMVVAAPLDPANRFQARLAGKVGSLFREAAKGPGFLIGVRRK
jgi:4-amino-4-deoxy-L-arabinose transferase-like glycosyltransferase